MSNKGAKQQFTERVTCLIKSMSGSMQQYEQDRLELERIFGRGWTAKLEARLSEPREVCVSCKLDYSVGELSGNDRCFACERAERANSIR